MGGRCNKVLVRGTTMENYHRQISREALFCPPSSPSRKTQQPNKRPSDHFQAAERYTPVTPQLPTTNKKWPASNPRGSPQDEPPSQSFKRGTSMENYHPQVSSKALFCPPTSPSRKTRQPKKGSSDHFQAAEPYTPVTPQLPPNNKKRSASRPQDEPPSQRQRTDDESANNGSKLEYCCEGDSSSVLVSDDLIRNMEEMVKTMTERVSSKKGLMSDPVLACLVSAQTVMMACIAELMSRRSEPPPEQRSKDYSSSTNRTVDKEMRNKFDNEPKN